MPQAMYGQPSMLGDGRHDRQQLDALGDADDIGRKVPVQSDDAARAAIWAMCHDGIEILA